MTYRYYFCIPYHHELISLLEKEKARYKLSGPLGKCFSDGTPVPVFISFEFKNYSPIIDQISEDYRCKPQVSVSYASSEINNAKLLWITPKNQSVDLLNVEQTFSYHCTWIDQRGIRRVHRREPHSSLVIAKEPPINTRTAFWSPSTGFSEIFTDIRVREQVYSNNLQGIDFETVLLPNGSSSNNIFRLHPHKRIETAKIVMGKSEKEIICPRCGYTQYLFDDTYQLHLALEEKELTVDLATTERIFGPGIPRPIYVISQRFYQILKEHKLTSNVHFDPVVLVK